MFMKRFLCLLLSAVTIVLCSCSNENKSGTEETTGYLESQSEVETTVLDTYQNFLDGITYLNFELGKQDSPTFVGRWFEKKINNVSHMVTLNDGSALYFMTDGAKSVDVVFTNICKYEDPYFSYSIDGSEPVRQHVTKSKVELPDDGMHVVIIYADGIDENAESKWVHEVGFAFKKISVETGSVYGIKPKSKVIAYYGDSITEGVNALTKGSNAESNSGTKSYAYFCSQALGAVTHNVGYGGSGVTKSGSFNTFINAIKYLSRGREVDTSFKPDVIVVNHGTNDNVSANDTTFIKALKDALECLMEKYPDTPIFYMMPFSQRSVGAIQKTLDTYFADADITVVETASWGITTTLGSAFLTDTLHPNIRGAKVAGVKLAAAIEAKLGEDFFKVN